MRATEVELDIPYEFTSVELLQLGRMMAEERFRLQQTMEERETVIKLFKGRLEGHEQEIYRLAGLVKHGAENRPTKCHIIYNDPHPGEKSLYRKDTGELVKTVPMTPDERQEELPITDSDHAPVTTEQRDNCPACGKPWIEHQPDGSGKIAPCPKSTEALFPEDATVSAIAEKVADAVNAGALDKAGVKVTAEVNPKKSRKKKEHYAADFAASSSPASTPPEAAN